MNDSKDTQIQHTFVQEVLARIGALPGPKGTVHTLQVDTGTFVIKQAGKEVALLFVQEDPLVPRNSRFRIEHWVLFNGYYNPPHYPDPSTSPSRRPDAPPLEFVKAGKDYQSFDDFRPDLVLMAPYATYIQARCQQIDVS
jgi:hypothetical protein